MINLNKKVIFNTKSAQIRKNTIDFPTVRKRIFLPNPKQNSMGESIVFPKKKLTMTPRFNEIGIQMLSKKMYQQVFIEGNISNNKSQKTIEDCKKELLKHAMITKEEDIIEDVDFRIPPLKGKNIEEHFKIIGEEQAGPFKELIYKILKGIPEQPEKWVMQEGWTRYQNECEPEKVEFPLEEILIFDIEVSMVSGKAPTLATAVSDKAWYAWVSPSVIEGTSRPVTTHDYSISSLIPLESTSTEHGIELTNHQLKPKVIIGHNVSFDRARIKEQYWLKKTGTRFIDTMSLHVCVAGLTSYQRTVIKSDSFNEDDDSWKKFSSLNNLADCYKLYCDKTLKKETRNIFVEGTLSDVKENFQSVMTYCCNDVRATYEIFTKLFPLFLERFPHPVTLAGMLELSTAYLPINSNWKRYIEESEQAYEDLESEGKILLAQKADQACRLLHDDKYKEDLWMWDEDWSVKDLKLKLIKTGKKTIKSKKEDPVSKTSPNKPVDDEETDPLEEKFRYLWETKENLPTIRPILPGYPTWYKKLCTKPNSSPIWAPGPHLISTSMKITPKLLCLTWEGFPLHNLRGKGWGFLVPFSDDVEIERNLPLKKLLEKCPLPKYKEGFNSWDAMRDISKNVQKDLGKREFYSKVKKDYTNGLYKGTGVWCSTEIEECCWFFKLPHKDGTSYNVGNPLSKDFLNKFSENVLAGESEGAEKVLEIARKLSYWRNNRKRIFDQMAVWLDDESCSSIMKDQHNLYGAIIPQVVVCGTLTRRAVEPTWMTASNANSERIGSELRAMVQAPPGYNIVGADVDSQELWIASILGDASHAQVHGATPLGWMTISGNKAAQTDMHSITAKAIGISRNHAKVINYARIYGAGQSFAESLLKQFNPSMSDAEARSKAQKMFKLTKGTKYYYLKPEYLTEFPNESFTKWQAFEIAKAYGKTVDEVFFMSRWFNGTESAMFNRLEEIANSDHPRTPFLEGRLSRALEPRSKEDRYLPTKVNWVVQSGAADFLHLMLVCMRWIMNDKVRFCLSFHDEVRYLVSDPYKYQSALALHVTNLLTRAFCSYRLGIHDLPQSVAFFSAVEIDKVLRKDAKDDCVTPSNPHGLSNGYGIENGEELDIYQAIKKAKGQYSSWYSSKFDFDETSQRKKRISSKST